MFDQFICRIFAPLQCLIEVVFRVCLSLIFLVGGLGHFMRSDQMMDRLLSSPWIKYVELIGSPLGLLHLSGAVFILASIALMFGWSARLAALALFATLVPITFTIHIAPGHEGPLFKNIAILGALLLVAAKGAGCASLDRTRTNRLSF